MAAAFALATVGPAAAANPVTVTIAAASSSSGQACVTVSVKDSVTNQPLATDFVLALSAGAESGQVPVKSDTSGNGSVCFNPPTGTGPNNSPLPPALSASVSLDQSTPLVVHAGPDYQTTGTSNSVTVKFSGTTVTPPPAGTTSADGMSMTLGMSSSSVLVGQPATVNVALSYSGSLTATSVSVELDFSGVGLTGVSGGGSCSGTTTVTCSVPDMGKGASQSVAVTLTPTGAGQISVTGRTRFTTTTTNPNSLQTFPLTYSVDGTTSGTAVAPQADLSVTLKSVKAQVGKQVSLTALVRNTGPQAAVGSNLSFVLPSGLRLVRFNGKGVTCHIATRTCSIALLGSSALTQVVLVVVPTVSHLQRLTAKVAAVNVTDPVSKNNVATLTLTVLKAKRS